MSNGFLELSSASHTNGGGVFFLPAQRALQLDRRTDVIIPYDGCLFIRNAIGRKIFLYSATHQRPLYEGIVRGVTHHPDDDTVKTYLRVELRC